ncbi:TonB-dependent receptor [uncultured Parabacteroides sp.]|uniref:SusC/RagA family TonB-linked outer membrane protein n=1 Tax=uncultured Parabacteroides sp. TaxID=512312 RepID=UPI00265AF200|nr:TonB-dependent receptor [uncultured Parabacteroides sp.]
MLKIARPVSFLLLSAALCSSGTVFAANETATPKVGISQQQKSLKGTVNDVLGPVAGASVVVKGTTNGTVTDMDGNFVLEVNNGDVLQISFIGYVTQEIKYTGQATLAVNLVEDTQKLEEVVVVGYGTQKKVNMTGAVAMVDSKVLENRPVQNVSTALQGTMPGVQVTSGGGRPGQDGGTIRVRGVGTLNTADPYILVDGIETGTMNSVDPNDIESISVLKDAASAAIYGSKASNGVILITTKRGKTGKPRISYNGYVGFQRPTEMIDRISSYDYARLYSQSMSAEGLTPRFDETDLQKFKDGSSPDTHPNTDWYDEAYQTGVQHSHNVSVSGGTENAKYMGSVGYLGQTGILPNADRQQFNARTNLDLKLNSKLTVRLNLAYIKNDYADPISSYASGISDSGNPNSAASSDQIIRQLNRISPWIVGRAEDGSYGTISDGSPLAWLDVDQTVKRKNQNFSGTLAADYKIIDGLVATVTGSYVNNQQHYIAFQKYIKYNPNKETEQNRAEERFTGWHRASFDALLNYDKQFGEHGLKAMAGWHTEKYDYSFNHQFRKNFPTNDLTDMNAGDPASQKSYGFTRELAMISWFGRINYDYAGKYLLEGNIRADASSRFADGNRWGYFPSFSAAWRISEEGFMENTKDWLNNLKIRGSWGLLGNQDALNDYYPWMNTYALDASYPLGGALQSGYYQDSYKLASISWEKSRTWGLGFDATLNNKINVTFDYYDRKTTGIIMDVPVPQEFGLGAYKDNVGEMSNRGVEVILSYNNKWGDWSFGATGNFAYNKNILQDLGLSGSSKEMQDPNNGNKIRRIGEALNTYLVYEADGFFESDEAAQAYMDKYAGKDGYPFSKKFKAGDLIYKDTNNDGKIDDSDRVLAGSTDPKFTFGLNLNAAYKNFDLSMTFTGAAGVSRLINKEVTGYFAGDDSHPATVWLDAWTQDNKDASMPRVAYDESSNNYTTSTFWVQNSSYLRMKNLQFGYTLPKNVLKSVGIENVRFYYSVENLFTIHNMLVSVDPEIGDERGSSFPLTQTHAFGVNVTF